MNSEVADDRNGDPERGIEVKEVRAVWFLEIEVTRPVEWVERFHGCEDDPARRNLRE